jgi:DNA-binding transcriptional ArsR family regulator
MDARIDEPGLRATAAIMRELGDPVRIAVVDLLAREARTASQLAGELGISAPRLANHLARLRAAGIVTVTRSGRHAIYRLADARIAGAVGTLRALAPTGTKAGGRAAAGPAPAASRSPGSPGQSLAEARTCYDHLAGRLGVAVFDHLVAAGALLPPAGTDNCEIGLGPDAAAGFAALGVDIAALPRRRKPATTCLDWTQRRPHLGGALGAAVLDRALAAGWVRRADGRGLTVTAAGRRHLPPRVS